MEGKTNKLKKLYTDVYPKLVLYSNILSEFINLHDNIKTYYNTSEFKDNVFTKLVYSKEINKYDSYIKLAKELNKINSNYYIYYYLYNPKKIFSLNKFNYYQIPTNSPTKYLYYDGNNKEDDSLVNIASGNPHTIKSQTSKKTKLPKYIYSEGYINQFNIGNYSSILDDYNKMKLPTSQLTRDKNFIKNKKSSLPP